MSSPIALAGKRPTTPSAVKSFLLIMSASIVCASANNFVASVPYFGSCKILGYLPFNSHVIKSGVQSMCSLILERSKFFKTFVPRKDGFVILALAQSVLRESERAFTIDKNFLWL